MKKTLLIALFITNAKASVAALAVNVQQKVQGIQKILFGSCAHQDKDMPILKAINKENADLFVFLGDNIYGDTENMADMAKKYQKLGAIQGIKTLRASTPTIAIWDDHDYGENDAGSEYPEKESSRKLMLDFWKEAVNSARYTRSDGIYTSYMFGIEQQKVHVILPDLRWNRDPLEKVSLFTYQFSRKSNNMGPYLAHEAVKDTEQAPSMLGETQWQWLEAELQKPSKIKVIASSFQLLPEFTGWESWANFPADRERLFSLIKKHQVNGVIIISGDTHWGEVSKVTENLNYPLWEITSSGLTQEWKAVSPNKHRVGEFIDTVNYGELRINWRVRDPVIIANLKNVNGQVVNQHRISLSSISPY